MSNFYRLDENRNPVPVEDDREYFLWLREQQESGQLTLQVARDMVEVSGRTITISTVFLGSDHNWDHGDKPVLWETMAFGLSDDEEMDRYTSEADALAGHAEYVARAMSLPGARVLDQRKGEVDE